MRRALPKDITSHDLLKAAALFLMVIDHVGAYLYPDALWLRAIGRMSAPMWLFLVGFARSRDLSSRFLGWAAACEAGLFLLGEALVPVNIFFTIALCRLAIDPIMRASARARDVLFITAAVAFILAFPSFLFFEYGTSAILPVMLGALVRSRRDAEAPPSGALVLGFAVFAGALYAGFEMFLFSDFSKVQMLAAGAGVMIVFLLLTRFCSAVYPDLSPRLSAVGAGAVRIAGRRSLEFYVLHVLLLKAAAVFLGTSETQLFDFRVF